MLIRTTGSGAESFASCGLGPLESQVAQSAVRGVAGVEYLIISDVVVVG